jgi:dienelactone hydrolase
MVLAAGCTTEHPRPVRFEVASPSALFDAGLGVRILGLRPGQRVTVDAAARAADNATWRARATFVADDAGTVDPATTAPVDGDYSGVQETGLLWSVHAAGADFFRPAGTRIPMTLTASVGGHKVAEASLTRLLGAPDVTETPTDLARDGFAGTMFQPAGAGTGAPWPAVLAFGGSEGGVASGTIFARALASRGIPALGIGYFGAPGLPPRLTEIPLEYFVGALRYLARQPGVDPHRVYVFGASRGSEAALLLAVNFPDLVHGVVGASPSSVVNPAAPPDSARSAWTLRGQPVPFAVMRDFRRTDPENAAAVIPVERIAGPVLLVCGEADRAWPSCDYSAAIATRMGATHSPILVREPYAGHLVDLLMPNIPLPDPDAASPPFGGTRQADALARQDAWPKLLTFLTG